MKVLASALLAVFFCVRGLSQLPEDVEKRIAALPADQQTHERFRYWISMQPVEVQRGPSGMQKYREYLRLRGIAESDIAVQIRTIEQAGRRLEVERWNQILTAEKPRFNTKPNTFLVEVASQRKPGTALDVGMGQGRNAIWLAQQGWDVTGFDPAEKAVGVAIETARKAGVRLKTEIKGSEDFDFGENRWNLILLSYVGARDLAGRVQKALKPGGIVILEAFHREAAKGRSIGGGVVFDTGEAPSLFPALRAVRYEEPLAVGDFGQERVRLIRYCAEKPIE